MSWNVHSTSSFKGNDLRFAFCFLCCSFAIIDSNYCRVFIKTTFLYSFYQGVYIGLLLGFAIGLWISVGAKVYPPPVSKAPVSTEGCKADVLFRNSTVNSTRYSCRRSQDLFFLYNGIHVQCTSASLLMMRLKYFNYQPRSIFNSQKDMTVNRIRSAFTKIKPKNDPSTILNWKCLTCSRRSYVCVAAMTEQG